MTTFDAMWFFGTNQTKILTFMLTAPDKQNPNLMLFYLFSMFDIESAVAPRPHKY